jgi:prefoldin subunit 5
MAIDSSGEENINNGHHLSAAHLMNQNGHHRTAAHTSNPDDQAKDADEVSSLMEETRKASEAYKTCIGPDGHHSHISLALLSEGKPKTNEECEAERDALEKTYVKAYVELSRLKAEYEELANSTACFDSVNAEYNSRHPPLQETADKLSSQINEKVKTLQSLRPRLEGAKSSEQKLRQRVQALTAQCKNVGATVSDLDKVRDAIESLSDCPGLSRVKFSMPKWVGTWATFDQNAEAQSDTEQDRLMSVACSKISAGSRAAEAGEIAEQTVEGIPVSNTASNSLMGACPDCAGAEDDSFQSAHARVCWGTGKDLTLAGRSNNCGVGKKAILCVQDRPDVRVIPGGGGQA